MDVTVKKMDVMVDEFKTSISDLPEEVLVKIFSQYIDCEGRRKFLKNVAPVCEQWKRISSTATFWRRITDIDFNFYDIFSLGEDGLLRHTKHLCLSHLSYLSSNLTYIRDVRDVDAAITWILSMCNDLRSLDLSSHIVSKELFSSIAKSCPNLENFVLQRTTGLGVNYWKLSILKPIINCSFHSLKSINLDDCKLISSNDTLESIADTCHSLEEFHFYFSSDYFRNSFATHKHTEITFPVTRFQTGCPNLRVLKVGKCYFACSNAEKTDGFPNLQVFGARRSRFHKNDLSLILRTSTKLVALELWDCSHGNTFCVDLLQISCPNLKKLILRQMKEFIPLYLRKLVSRWSHTLTQLGLVQFHVDVSKVLSAVLRNNPQPVLESLDFSESFVSLLKLKSIVSHCAELNDLKLKHSALYSKLQDSSVRRSLPKTFPEVFSSRQELQKILEY